MCMNRMICCTLFQRKLQCCPVSIFHVILQSTNESNHGVVMWHHWCQQPLKYSETQEHQHYRVRRMSTLVLHTHIHPYFILHILCFISECMRTRNFVNICQALTIINNFRSDDMWSYNLRIFILHTVLARFGNSGMFSLRNYMLEYEYVSVTFHIDLCFYHKICHPVDLHH